MGRNLTHKLIESHLVEGELRPGHEIGLRVDQTLTQDATGTMVMLELEAMELERARTEDCSPGSSATFVAASATSMTSGEQAGPTPA